jgi:hypothetical protein
LQHSAVPRRHFTLGIACYHCFSNEGEKGKVKQSNWLKDCPSDCDISEAVEVSDIFKDSLVDSGRFRSVKRHHRTFFTTIDEIQQSIPVASAQMQMQMQMWQHF